MRRSCAATCSDPAALDRAMGGCSLVYHVAGVNSHCPKDPQRLMRVNVDGTEQVVRAAARAGIGRVVFTSSAAAIGEANGTVGHEDSPHRGTYLSLYDRSKHEAERVAFAAGAETGVEVVALNPSSVQGPPRKGGNGAIVIAYLNGRLPAFVDTHVSIVDVQDVVCGAPARGRARRRRAALRAQRRDAAVDRGARTRLLVGGRRRARPDGPAAASRAASSRSPTRRFGCAGRSRRSAARASRRSFTAIATTARERSASWASATRRRPRRSAARSSGRCGRAS